MLTVTLGEQSDTLKPNHKRKIKHITPGQLARALTSPGAHAPFLTRQFPLTKLTGGHAGGKRKASALSTSGKQRTGSFECATEIKRWRARPNFLRF